MHLKIRKQTIDVAVCFDHNFIVNEYEILEVIIIGDKQVGILVELELYEILKVHILL